MKLSLNKEWDSLGENKGTSYEILRFQCLKISLIFSSILLTTIPLTMCYRDGKPHLIHESL